MTMPIIPGRIIDSMERHFNPGHRLDGVPTEAPPEVLDKRLDGWWYTNVE